MSRSCTHESHGACTATARIARCPGGASAGLSQSASVSEPRRVSSSAFVAWKLSRVAGALAPRAAATMAAGTRTGSKDARSRVGSPRRPAWIDSDQNRFTPTRCSTTSCKVHPPHRLGVFHSSVLSPRSDFASRARWRTSAVEGERTTASTLMTTAPFRRDPGCACLPARTASHVLIECRRHDLQARAHGQGQQAFAAPGDIGHRHDHLLRHGDLTRQRVRLGTGSTGPARPARRSSPRSHHFGDRLTRSFRPGAAGGSPPSPPRKVPLSPFGSAGAGVIGQGVSICLACRVSVHVPTTRSRRPA